MDSGQTVHANEIDRRTIKATVCSLFAAELTTVVSAAAPTLNPYQLCEDTLAVIPVLQERVVLVGMSYRTWKTERDEKGRPVLHRTLLILHHCHFRPLGNHH